MKGLWRQDVQDLIGSKATSEDFRLGFNVGCVSVKVSAMFNLGAGTSIPSEAQTVAVLLLSGLESCSAEQFARSEAEAMGIFAEWRHRNTRREAH